MSDMFKKGRNKGNGCIGEKHKFSKLKNHQVIEIRRLHTEGVKQNVLAKQFGVSTATLNSIVLNKTWKHLLPPMTLING